MGWLFFFFQAEDGIRDLTVTGVQTCALPICSICGAADGADPQRGAGAGDRGGDLGRATGGLGGVSARLEDRPGPSSSYFLEPLPRSEEHTSELQSQSNLVCRLLLEKKTKHKSRPHASDGLIETRIALKSLASYRAKVLATTPS